jgi:hypothetical protein
LDELNKWNLPATDGVGFAASIAAAARAQANLKVLRTSFLKTFELPFLLSAG